MALSEEKTGRRDGRPFAPAEGHSRSPSTAYGIIERKISASRCVMLDGGTATELPRLPADHSADERLWGTSALLSAPEAVLSVHRRYADVGCDVISTNTWGLPSALGEDGAKLWGTERPVHWMDVARQGIGLARRAVFEAGRSGECVVAFSLNGDLDTPENEETIRLLARVFEEEPPDLILVETLSLVRSSTYETVERLLETGLPLWLSFRRCRHGVCGVFGEHWGGPEGDAFGRAARRFEALGVGALLVNCVPPDHVPGMLPWLRDFIDMPCGVYPNLGYLSREGWSYDAEVGGAEYAEMALGWREEGAQIVGGCCGVRPEHIAAAREALADTEPGNRRPETPVELIGGENERVSPTVSGWTDARGRNLFPLEFPDIVCEPGVFVPTQGSFLLWRYLFREGVGAGRRCLDVGCGTGLLTAQLALNGAAHVHAIDLEEHAAANTLTNAFRNGVADRVTAASEDLYLWIPEEPYDVMVASLYQTPVDPLRQSVTHRPLDYWGRNLVDNLISKLPDALAPDGVAYLMQLSILGQRRTAELLEEKGLTGRVVDFGFMGVAAPFDQEWGQILRVEATSDAYHLTFADDEDVMVAYLLEITHTGS